MKKIYTALTTLLVLLFVFSLCSTASAADAKIGFVNTMLIVSKSEMGKTIGAELKKTVEQEFKQLQRREEELAKIRADLDKQRGVLRPEAFQEKEVDLQKKVREFQVTKNNVNDDMQLKQQEKMNEIGKAIMEVIEVIGKNGKYTVILDVYSTQPPYYDKANDLTEAVIKELNNR